MIKRLRVYGEIWISEALVAEAVHWRGNKPNFGEFKQLSAPGMESWRVVVEHRAILAEVH